MIAAFASTSLKECQFVEGHQRMYRIEIVDSQPGSKWDDKDWNWEVTDRGWAANYAADLIRLLRDDPDAPRHLIMAGFGWGDEARPIGELEILLYLMNEKIAA
jgi:hypothetical protein